MFLLAFYQNIYNTTDHPKVASTLNSIAVVYSELGQHEKAVQAFENVIGKALKNSGSSRRMRSNSRAVTKEQGEIERGGGVGGKMLMIQAYNKEG